MPKGRRFAPCTNGDGVWFPHRDQPAEGGMLRETSTSTGVMLTAPLNPITAARPPPPPPKYLNKDAKTFKDSNNFSAHDNRNAFQDHGVYLGNGRDTRALGKRLTAPTVRQHHTEKDMLKHHGRSVTDFDYSSIYAASYEGNQTTERPSRRRFPKVHKEGLPALTKLDTSTTHWFKEPEVPFKTPLHVLAVSQEPFLGPNKWKYSNHSLAKCYPPYDKVDKNKPFPIWMVQGPKAIQDFE